MEYIGPDWTRIVRETLSGLVAPMNNSLLEEWGGGVAIDVGWCREMIQIGR